MVTIEAAIRSYLLSIPAITNRVGERIFTGIAPNNTLTPCLTMHVISDRAFQVLKGLTNRREALIDLTIWATENSSASGYSIAREIAEILRVHLIGQRFQIDGIDVQTILDEGILTLPPREDGLAQIPFQISVTYFRP